MILVLGGKGYVATAFAEELERAGRPHRVLSRAEADYTDRAELRRVLREYKPEFLVNAAGYTGKPNVDACETDRANCLFGNGVFPGYVREVCEELKQPWGQVSSGCIYTGEKEGGAGFTEEDPPNFCFRTDNCSFYSGTKALGEEVLAGAEQCYVWRIRIPYNNEAHPRNYLQKLLSYRTLLDAKNSISHLNEAVRAALACFDREAPFGIYNVTNPGAITTRQVVGWMREESDRRKSEGLENPFDKEFRFFESEEEFLRLAAATPRSNCVMDPAKLLATGIELTAAEEAVRGALRAWAEAPAPARARMGAA
jgi:dTDP-4-dehydrorhamnose reductase